MSVIKRDGTVNGEVLYRIRDLIYENLQTPENVRSRIQWKIINNKISNEMVRTDSSYDFIDLKFSGKVKTDYVPGLLKFITDPKNGSRRFLLDNNPTVVRIKNRVEALLDEALFNTDMTALIKEHGFFLIFEADVDFVDKTVTIDDEIEISVTASVCQRD